jgi:hypothetical protein
MDPVFFFHGQKNYRFALASKVKVTDLYRLEYLQRSLKTDPPLDALFFLK